jgi:N-acetylmuramoyl-L-alanine amidase
LFLLPALVLAVEEKETSLPSVLTATTPRAQVSADATDGKYYIIAIDAGHSEKHPGPISASGRAEYKFNRDMAERVRAALATDANIRPFIITSPTEITLPERSRIATAKNAHLFISVHHDSAQDQYLKTHDLGG